MVRFEGLSADAFGGTLRAFVIVRTRCLRLRYQKSFMTEAGIGRLLVASLHQGIADLLPTRLEFYES